MTDNRHNPATPAPNGGLGASHLGASKRDHGGEGVVDIAIAGGGLAGALIAWALKQTHPQLRVAVFEAGARLGGNHTWSFHETDLDAQGRRWLAPLLAHRWTGQRVAFPGFERDLSTPYGSITSERLHQVIAPALQGAVRFGTPVEKLSADHVTLQTGEHIDARAVIDCRGDQRSPHMQLGFQKFVGQTLRFAKPHGLTAPIIMDARVAQKDGYRFVYVLPFDPHTALIEDTRYADGAALSETALRQDIADYAAAQNWRVEETVHEEAGVLPIALAGDIDAYWRDGPAGVARAGMRAALFHPLTGYSLPDAAALARAIAASDDLSGPALYALTRDFSKARWRERGFYRLLCRMLYRAAQPDQRYKVLARFYKLPQPLIERFYAGVSPLKDRARILMGKPPVPIGKALLCLSEKQALKTA